ncbi:MAG TPA: Gldg family protein [Candidatus Binataceae bacterium]
MRRSSAISGIIGLVLLAFGLVDYFIASGFRLFVYINLIAGLFAIIVWITSSRDALSSIVGRRTTRFGANAVVYSVGFVGLLVAINYLASQHHRRFDMTEERVFSLSSQSVNVLKNLQKPIKFYGFFEGGQSPSAKSLYQTYAYASPKVTFELVDPDKHPELAERFKVSTMGTTHIQYGDEGAGTNVGETTEDALTNAIIKVTKHTKKTIYFLEGHGEADPDDTQAPIGFGTLRQALEGEGYEVKKLLLATQAKVPEDCTILVIAGPQKPLFVHELDEVNSYLKRDGRVLATLQPPQPDNPTDESGLIKLIGDWGVQVGNDVVVDQVVRLFAGPALGLNPVVSTYGVHPITRGFNQRTVFPMVRSVEPAKDLKAGLSVVAIARTSDTSWAETDLEGIFKRQTATLDDKDRRGPITVCAAVEADLKTLGWGSGEARMVVFGTTEFANNQNINTFFNRDFFINSVDWLAGQENSISIRPRSIRASRFRLTVDQFSVVFALSVLLLPELLLIVGIAVWWERRN